MGEIPPPEGSKAGSGVETPRSSAAGCAAAALVAVALLLMTIGFLLAWPYLTGTARRRHPPAVYQSATPLLAPPEHSDEGSR